MNVKLSMLVAFVAGPLIAVAGCSSDQESIPGEFSVGAEATASSEVPHYEVDAAWPAARLP